MLGRKPTPKLIADWARILYTAYPGDAAKFCHNPSALNCEICESSVVMQDRLAAAVAEQMPEIWPQLRLVSRSAIWHADPTFDWAAAEGELRRIEAAALSEVNLDRKRRPARSDPGGFRRELLPLAEQGDSTPGKAWDHISQLLDAESERNH